MGCFLSPDDALTIEDVVAAIGKRPQGSALLVVGDLNTDLAAPEGREQDKGIVEALEGEGLEDMSFHFLPRYKLWLKDSCTWAMRRGVWEVLSRTYYILGIGSCLFQNAAVWDARHNTDHYLVLGCLRGAKPTTYSRYLGKRTRFPIRPKSKLNKAERMFAELQGAIPKPLRRERHRKEWIYPETWSLIDTSMEALRRKDQRSSQDLAREIKAAIQGDWRRRMAEAGSAVESLLASDPPLIRESWIRMQGWYKEEVDRIPLPSRVSLTTMTAEREHLYWHVPLMGEAIPVQDPPFTLSVDDSIPEDEEIASAVCRLCLNLSGGP